MGPALYGNAVYKEKSIYTAVRRLSSRPRRRPIPDRPRASQSARRRDRRRLSLTQKASAQASEKAANGESPGASPPAAPQRQPEPAGGGGVTVPASRRAPVQTSLLQTACIST